jgi:hypothetical protein
VDDTFLGSFGFLHVVPVVHQAVAVMAMADQGSDSGASEGSAFRR